MTGAPTLDVAVVGDGPAGSALARDLHDRGVDVALFGNDRPWSATYTTWVDDLEGVAVVDGADIWLRRFGSVAARFLDPVTIDREYGVIDNDALLDVLRRDVHHRVGAIGSANDVEARIVVDATGWPSGLDPTDRSRMASGGLAWQTALGVVLPEPPAGSLGSPTVMDFSSVTTGPPRDVDGGVDTDGVDGHLGVPTFAYAFPVADGWLVEETVLAGPPLDPDELTPRLARRLGEPVDALVARARRIERVRIPMGAPVPARPDSTSPAVVRFGAAAGMIHTATGYSVAASLRAVDRVGSAMVQQLAGEPDGRALADAVWPQALRRSRRLHDYGLGVLLDMNVDDIRRFFQAFFELPSERWAAYLRVDTPPAELAGVMTAMFTRADWGLRRRLVAGDLRLLPRALWP